MGKTIIVSEDTMKRVIKNIKPEKDDFNVQIRVFLKNLLADPVHAEIPKCVSMAGVSKHKLLDMMQKIGMLEYSERLNDKNKDGSFKDKVTMKVKYKLIDKIPDELEYKVPKNKFDQKVEKLRIMIFDKNVPEGINEDLIDECGGATGCCGVTDGANTISMPLFGVIRKTPKTS